MPKVVSIKGTELWDEGRQAFTYLPNITFTIEHSLISISKWERKWCKPFITQFKDDRTDEEALDYIGCMVLDKNFDMSILKNLPQETLNEIYEYINQPMTATRYVNKNGKRETITYEQIYSWMFLLNIPFDCRRWHLNSLLALIETCRRDNTPDEKISHEELMERNRRINEERKRKWNTRG